MLAAAGVASPVVGKYEQLSNGMFVAIEMIELNSKSTINAPPLCLDRENLRVGIDS